LSWISTFRQGLVARFMLYPRNVCWFTDCSRQWMMLPLNNGALTTISGGWALRRWLTAEPMNWNDAPLNNGALSTDELKCSVNLTGWSFCVVLCLVWRYFNGILCTLGCFVVYHVGIGIAFSCADTLADYWKLFAKRRDEKKSL
jgi:hypothetical protein